MTVNKAENRKLWEDLLIKHRDEQTKLLTGGSTDLENRAMNEIDVIFGKATEKCYRFSPLTTIIPVLELMIKHLKEQSNLQEKIGKYEPPTMADYIEQARAEQAAEEGDLLALPTTQVN